MAAQLTRALGCLGIAAQLLVLPAAFAGDDAGHALAEKFSHAGDAEKQKARAQQDESRKALEQKLQQEERLKADEAEMLERAKAEAAERKADEARRQAEAERAAEDKRKADQALAEQARAAQEKADQEKRLAAEKAAAERKAADERLAAERKAEGERKAAEERLAAEKAEAERKAAEERLIATRKAEAERAAAAKAEEEHLAREAAEIKRREEANRQAEAAADEKRRVMEAEREEEARQLSEKLKRAREKREAKDTADPNRNALGNPPPETLPPPVETAEPQPPPASAPEQVAPQLRGTQTGDTRATILLVMEPGTRGIRRYEKTGDPIICIGASCYISGGPNEPAIHVTRTRAFGPGQALGQRAGACRKSLKCVFRGVEIGTQQVELQPIDLRIMRHDRRETRSVAIDPTCVADRGHLHCSKGVTAQTYRAWVVPESVAETAGNSALTSALANDLHDDTALRN